MTEPVEGAGKKPAPAAKIASSKVVAYIGNSDWREISVAGWDDSDIKGEDRLWSAHNGWQIPVDKFSDDELKWLDADEDFIIKDAVLPPAAALKAVGELNVP